MQTIAKSLVAYFFAISIVNSLFAVEDCAYLRTMSGIPTEKHHQNAQHDHVSTRLNAASGLVQQIMTRYNPLHLETEQQAEWEKGYFRRLSSGPYVATDFNDEQTHMESSSRLRKDIQPQIELLFSQTIKVAEGFPAGNFNVPQQGDNKTEINSFKEREMNDEIVQYLPEAKRSVLEGKPDFYIDVLMAIDGEFMASIADDSFETSSLTHTYDTKPNPLFFESDPQPILTARKILENAWCSDESQLELTIQSSDLEIGNYFNFLTCGA